MSDDTILVATEGLAIADLDEEAVVLDVNSGIYYGLNEVGARVMVLLKEPTSLSDIVNAMLQEYEVEGEQLKRDLMAFLQEMKDQQLIRIKNGVAT